MRDEATNEKILTCRIGNTTQFVREQGLLLGRFWRFYRWLIEIPLGSSADSCRFHDSLARSRHWTGPLYLLPERAWLWQDRVCRDCLAIWLRLAAAVLFLRCAISCTRSSMMFIEMLCPSAQPPLLISFFCDQEALSKLINHLQCFFLEVSVNFIELFIDLQFLAKMAHSAQSSPLPPPPPPPQTLSYDPETKLLDSKAKTTRFHVGWLLLTIGLLSSHIHIISRYFLSFYWALFWFDLPCYSFNQ